MCRLHTHRYSCITSNVNVALEVGLKMDPKLHNEVYFLFRDYFQTKAFFPSEITQTTMKSLCTITIPCTKRNNSLQEKGRPMTQS